MNKKTFIAAAIIAGFLLSLFGMQLNEVVIANPPPYISINSPADQTCYNSSTVLLDTVTVTALNRLTSSGVQYETLQWLNYSLDGVQFSFTNWTFPPNAYFENPKTHDYTIPGYLIPYATYANVSLTNLSNGTHSLTVYGQTTFGTMLYSSATFSVNLPPIMTITILSVENKTYGTSCLPLTYNINGTDSWTGYSLDNQENVTASGNVTLTDLTEGNHSLVVYANDTFGNMEKSDTVFFTVDTTPPNILLLSPQSTTYTSTNLPLNFTLNKSTSWMGYSLDNQANVTINGNSTLDSLSSGAHTLAVYANDTIGNMGKSVVISFNVFPPPTQQPTLEPTQTPSIVTIWGNNIIWYFIVGAIIAIVVLLLLFLLKRRI